MGCIIMGNVRNEAQLSKLKNGEKTKKETKTQTMIFLVFMIITSF